MKHHRKQEGGDQSLSPSGGEPGGLTDSLPSAKPLRLAMLSMHTCPLGRIGGKDTGGMNVYLRELARELGAAGHSVDVFTRAHDPAEEERAVLGPGARLVHVPAGKKDFVPKTELFPLCGEFARGVEAFRLRGRHDYDLIFSHYWLSGEAGESLRRLWGVPHLLMYHTLGAVKNAVAPGENEPPLRLFREKELAAGCTHLLAATAGEKANIIRYCQAAPEKISVIPCGVNLALFRPVPREKARRETGLARDQKTVLYIGRIEPVKGLERLLEAFALVPGQRARLLIIGGDEHSREKVAGLAKAARRLGIGEHVTILEAVAQERLPYYYSAAEAVVVPSYYESFGLAALEALACGTPVVAAPVGVLPQLLRQGDTGYLVQEGTPREFAAGISYFLEKGRTPGEAEKIRSTVLAYGWPHIAARLEAIFRNLKHSLI